MLPADLGPNLGFYYFLEKIKPYINLDDVKVIFDIGSRDAHESLYFEKEFPNCRIVAFEPIPEQYNYCVDITKDSENISIVKKAVSNFEGRAKFHKTPGNIGASSLLKPNFVPWTHDQTVQEIDVEVTTLDSFCGKDIVPDIFWMDVQGNELYTLQGAERILKNVKAIYCEAGIISYYDNHSLKDDIIKFLQERGFMLIDDKPDWSHETNLIFIKQ